MPHLVPDRGLPQQIMRARRALNLSQSGLGRLCGASRKTAARWEWGKSPPTPDVVLTLARAVYEVDREVAKLLAFQFGKTLVDLGLEKPPATPAPAPPTPAPVRASPPVHLMVESVVCAAAEALDTKPQAVRDVLRAAFSRARAMALTVEDVDAALSPPPPAGPAPAPSRAPARR